MQTIVLVVCCSTELIRNSYEKVNLLMIKKWTFTVLLVSYAFQAQSDDLAQEYISSSTRFYPAEELTFTSDNGGTYDIFIAMPPGFDADGDTMYPVVYVLDGATQFLLVNYVSKVLQLEGIIRPMILVGIDSSPLFSIQEWRGNRIYMFTPTRSEAFEQEKSEILEQEVRSGGAVKFRSVLKDEVIPWIEKRYSTSEERAIVGWSLGGLFAVDTLFKDPDLFSHYLIGSPSLWWDDQIIFEFEKSYVNNRNDLSARVYLSMGEQEVEEQVVLARKMSDTLMSREYHGLEMKFRVFEGETHMSVFPTTIIHGLRYLFAVD